MAIEVLTLTKSEQKAKINFETIERMRLFIEMYKKVGTSFIEK